jgi:AcrR family transcriptional regulator
LARVRAGAKTKVARKEKPGIAHDLQALTAPGVERAQSVTRKRLYAAAMRLFAEKGATRVTVSELAESAGVSRGTVYANVGDPEELFPEIAAHLIEEMSLRLRPRFSELDDVAREMAYGIRLYLRRAHDDPLWGRFVNRFGLSSATFQTLWQSDPVKNLTAGVASGRYSLKESQLPTAVMMLAGTVIAAMYPVLEGYRTWREVGSEAAELLLVAFGVQADEAHALATEELPVWTASLSLWA